MRQKETVRDVRGKIAVFLLFASGRNTGIVMDYDGVVSHTAWLPILVLSFWPPRTHLELCLPTERGKDTDIFILYVGERNDLHANVVLTTATTSFQGRGRYRPASFQVTRPAAKSGRHPPSVVY